MGRKKKLIEPIKNSSFEIIFDFCIGKKKDNKVIEKTINFKKNQTEHNKEINIDKKENSYYDN